MRISDWSSDVCSSDLFVRQQAGIVNRCFNFYGLAGVGALAPAAFASAGCWPGLLSLLALPSLLAELYRNLLISSSSTTALCVYWISLFCRSEEHTSELQSLMRISHAVL